MYIYIIYKRSHEGSKRFSNIGPTRHLYAWGVPNICIHISNLGQDLHKRTGLSKASAIRENVDHTTWELQTEAPNISKQWCQWSHQLWIFRCQASRFTSSCLVIFGHGVGESTVVGRLESLKKRSCCYTWRVNFGDNDDVTFMHLELTSCVTVKQHEETMYLFGFV